MMKPAILLSAAIALSGCDGRDPAKNCKDTRSAKIGAFVMSQGFVEQRLKSPSTADFPSYSAAGVSVRFLKACHFRVAAFVDAQNSFGGIARTNYEITVIADPKDGGYWAKDVRFY